MALFRSRWFLVPTLTAAVAFGVPRPAYAMKRVTIILRATGSGAAIGALAGLATKAFSDGGNPVVAGAVVGAVLGTVYGFHLADERDRRIEEMQNAASRGGPEEMQSADLDPNLLARGTPLGPRKDAWAAPVSLAIEF